MLIDANLHSAINLAPPYSLTILPPDFAIYSLCTKPYRNTYAWFMEMRDGKIVKVTAFFDSITFDDFWKRVQPRTK